MSNLNIIVKSVLQLLFMALVAYFLYLVSSVILFLVIAAVLTLVGKPLKNRICNLKIGRWNLPDWLGALLTMLVIIGIIVGIQLLIFPRLISEFSFLSGIDYAELLGDLKSEFDSVSNFMKDYNLATDDFFDEELSLMNVINIGNVADTLQQVVSFVGNIAIAIFSILFFMFFFLREKRFAEKIIFALTPAHRADHFENIVIRTKKTLTRYFIAITIQMVIVFTIVSIGLTIVGLKNVILIAVLASLFNLIPYLGPLMGAAVGIIIGIGQAYSLEMDINYVTLALQIAMVFGAMQLVDNLFTQPFIFGNSINAHPVEVFIVISVAGLLGGVLMMIVAVPGYAALRIIAEEFFPQNPIVRFVTHKPRVE